MLELPDFDKLNHREPDNHRGHSMTAQQAETATIQVDDYIQAWHNGKLFHQGRVTDVVRSLDLIWILDAGTGTRKLLDPEALEIVRIAGPPV